MENNAFSKQFLQTETAPTTHINPSHFVEKGSFPWQRLDIILSTLCLNLFSLVLPIMILQLYDRIIPNQAFNTLSVIILGVMIAVAFELIIRISRSYILSWMSKNFDTTVTEAMFNHAIGSNYYELKKIGIGEHVENIESISTLKEFMVGQGFLVLLDTPFLFLFLGLICYFGGYLMGTSVAVILIVFLIRCLFVGNHLKSMLQKRYDLSDRRYNFMIEILSHHFVIKALGIEELLMRRFERLQLQASSTEYDINLLSAEARDISYIFSSILFGSIATIAAYHVIHNTMSTGGLAACLFLSNRLMQPLQAGLSMWTRLQHFTISKDRFSKVFSLPLEENFGEKIDLKGNIVLKNLSFAYKDGPLLFDNINLSINQGEFVSIIGSNGAGKTTLSHLMIGDLAPKDGTITIDGVSFANINVPHFRKQVVYLEPSGTIFKGTIMENLTFFGSFGTLDDVMHLSQKIGLNKWINKQPLGYNTVIGHHLDGDLSLGILQRICFVRGILMKPKVLIIDEANTSFDIQGDQGLADLLREFKGKITIIFITHRPSLSRLADRTYKISNNTLEVYHENPRL